MKTSNKLLLGGFFTVVLLIAGMHIALYAKYKAGKYTIYHPENRYGNTGMQSLPNVKFITIRNLFGTTVRFGNITEIEKGKKDLVQYVQNGDSLIISGKNEEGGIYARSPIDLVIPFNVTLTVDNSNVNFDKGKEGIETNPVIFLNNSQAIFNYSKSPIQLGHVKITATDNSLAAFHGSTQVNNLEVQLVNSTLEYHEGDVGQISIATDTLSRILLQSKHLLKAKITPVLNNP